MMPDCPEAEVTLALRPVRPGDEPFLLRVYAGTREDELALVPWTRAEKDAFVRKQFDLQHRDYQERNPDAVFQVILADDEPVGRLYRADGHRIIDIAIVPEHRNRGLGSRLLADILAEADTAGKAVSIYVEVHNPARRLYDRLGFVPVEERGIYLLMRRPPAALR